MKYYHYSCNVFTYFEDLYGQIYWIILFSVKIDKTLQKVRNPFGRKMADAVLYVVTGSDTLIKTDLLKLIIFLILLVL